jgi:hypothetical protein
MIKEGLSAIMLQILNGVQPPTSISEVESIYILDWMSRPVLLRRQVKCAPSLWHVTYIASFKLNRVLKRRQASSSLPEIRGEIPVESEGSSVML